MCLLLDAGALGSSTQGGSCPLVSGTVDFYESNPHQILCLCLAAEEDSLVFEDISSSLLHLIVFYIIYSC